MTRCVYRLRSFWRQGRIPRILSETDSRYQRYDYLRVNLGWQTAQRPQRPIVPDPTKTIDANGPTFVVFQARNAVKLPAKVTGINNGWEGLAFCCRTMGGADGTWVRWEVTWKAVESRKTRGWLKYESMQTWTYVEDERKCDYWDPYAKMQSKEWFQGSECCSSVLRLAWCFRDEQQKSREQS